MRRETRDVERRNERNPKDTSFEGLVSKGQTSRLKELLLLLLLLLLLPGGRALAAST